MPAGKIRAGALALCAVILGLAGGLLARETLGGSHGPTGGNPAVTTTVPAVCPPGMTSQVIGQISPPNHAPIQVIQCALSIPTAYQAGTGLVP